MRALQAPPSLPIGIRVLRDAVIVMICIAAGGAAATLPYEPDPADPRMVEVFQAVFGTLGFALTAFLARSRRGLHVLLTTLTVWAVAGVLMAMTGGNAIDWAIRLVLLALMALLGGGLARLVERLARE